MIASKLISYINSSYLITISDLKRLLGESLKTLKCTFEDILNKQLVISTYKVILENDEMFYVRCIGEKSNTSLWSPETVGYMIAF